MSTWSGVVSKLRWSVAGVAVVIAVGVGASVFSHLTCEETARAAGTSSLAVTRQKMSEARQERAKAFRERWEQRERENEERWKRINEESERRRAEAEKAAENVQPRKRRIRKVRRWPWMSPVEKRAKTWNVPQEETVDATVTGLLRICTSEQEGSENDCLGIYQVLSNIRSRSCNREYFNLITECDDDGETLLSVMRRASRYVVGAEAPRYDRQRWISQMTTECTMPKAYPQTVRRHCRSNLTECGQSFWEKRHRQHCLDTVELARGLIDGTDTRRITEARIIAWGGRCEEPRGACDDPVACSRGLSRVPHIERLEKQDRPANAFWCRPGTHRCGADIDPLCIAMGFGGRDRLAEATATNEVRD